MPAIELRDVSLWRRTQEELAYDLKRIVLQSLEGHFKRPVQRCVLQGIDLTIERGEKFGIIGPNGAGKSTLLKIICGILRATTGDVRVDGRIAPLIELGAGFDNDLSVIDNIIYYGVLLGFARAEMRARIGPILEFAELEDYGKAPLKALSSGMVARLGFAIATDHRPDILILDEVFAVGDASFSRKSLARMEEFWDAHSTILFVSHGLDFIATECDRALWLDQGTIVDVGPADDVCKRYLNSVYSEAFSRNGGGEAQPFTFFLDLVTHGGETYTVSSATEIAPISVRRGDSVALLGWAADPINRVPAASVTFEINGRAIARAECRDVRTDVAQWYKDPRLGQCGFTVTLPTADLQPGRHQVWMIVAPADSATPYVVPFVLTIDITERGPSLDKASP